LRLIGFGIDLVEARPVARLIVNGKKLSRVKATTEYGGFIFWGATGMPNVQTTSDQAAIVRTALREYLTGAMPFSMSIPFMILCQDRFVQLWRKQKNYRQSTGRTPEVAHCQKRD
jgi:hypothetical protein